MNWSILAVSALLLLPVGLTVDDAEARPAPPVCVREPCGPLLPCVIGSDSDCKIKITCVQEPCHPKRVP
ncbi:MAG: hypothetical protein ACPGQL_02155 [Thermoplasmatota archaeon]